MTRRRPNAFTLTDNLVVLGLLAVLFGIGLPAAAHLRKQAQMNQNAEQLRGIHQGMVVWSQTSKKVRPGDSAFPGIRRMDGPIVEDGPATGYSGDGAVPAARLSIMLDGNFFTPDYIVSPADAHATEAPTSRDAPLVTHHNHSYAMLALPDVPPGGMDSEWADTLNPDAAVLSDRAIGTGPADLSSDWTDRGGGDWYGAVVRNDNSTAYGDDPVLTATQYGTSPPNPTDDIFEDDPAAADAFLVHDDATTAYSKD